VSNVKSHSQRREKIVSSPRGILRNREESNRLDIIKGVEIDGERLFNETRR